MEVETNHHCIFENKVHVYFPTGVDPFSGQPPAVKKWYVESTSVHVPS